MSSIMHTTPSTPQVLFDTHELQQLPRDELVRAYIDLSHRYAAEVERATEYQSRIQTSQVPLRTPSTS